MLSIAYFDSENVVCNIEFNNKYPSGIIMSLLSSTQTNKYKSFRGQRK